MSEFRFYRMAIWQRAAAISVPLFAFADQLEQRRRHRFAEQLRGAVLSITNNIAEGSGSVSALEFAQFLNISRRSIYEVVNMLELLKSQAGWDSAEVESLERELAEQSRMLLAFHRKLKRGG